MTEDINAVGLSEEVVQLHSGSIIVKAAIVGWDVPQRDPTIVGRWKCRIMTRAGLVEYALPDTETMEREMNALCKLFGMDAVAYLRLVNQKNGSSIAVPQ